jgi:hypothetical protein
MEQNYRARLGEGSLQLSDAERTDYPEWNAYIEARDKYFADVLKADEAKRVALEANREVEKSRKNLAILKRAFGKSATIRQKALQISRIRADAEPDEYAPRFGGLRGVVMAILKRASPEGLHVSAIYDEVLRIRREQGLADPTWLDPLANVEDPCWYFQKIRMPVVRTSPRTWAWRPDAEPVSAAGEAMR